MSDCRTCPQCKSKRTIALNEKFRRCKDCRHVYQPSLTRKSVTSDLEWDDAIRESESRAANDRLTSGS